MRFNAIKVYFSLASESSARGEGGEIGERRGGRRERTFAPSSHEGMRLLSSVFSHAVGLGVFHWVLCIGWQTGKERHMKNHGCLAIWEARRSGSGQVTSVLFP